MKKCLFYAIALFAFSSRVYATCDEKTEKELQQAKVKIEQLMTENAGLNSRIAQLQNQISGNEFTTHLNKLMEEGAKLCAKEPNTKFNPGTLACDVKPNETKDVGPKK